jgi:hypothetical protein
MIEKSSEEAEVGGKMGDWRGKNASGRSGRKPPSEVIRNGLINCFTYRACENISH